MVSSARLAQPCVREGQQAFEQSINGGTRGLPFSHQGPDFALLQCG